MKRVQERREQILRFLAECEEAGHPSPTVREICEALHIPSTSTVHSDLAALQQQGHILKNDGLNRTIRLPGAAMVRVPLLGTVTAGNPILAVEEIEEYIPFRGKGSSKDLFALHIKGESMIEAGILDGDIVVVEKTSTARNGELVVALIEDEATVKRFFKEKGYYRLQPENASFEPIIAEQVEILGRVLSVMRFYH